MIRAATRSVTCRPSLAVVHRRVPLVRHQSGTSGKSGGGFGAGKIIATSFVTIAGLAGGTIGYAQNDPEFKLLVEDNIPGSKDIFDAVADVKNAIDSLLSEVTSLVNPSEPPPKTVDISVPPSKLKVQMAAVPPMPDIEKPPENIEKLPEKIEMPPEKIEFPPEKIEMPPETEPLELKVPDVIVEEKASEAEVKIIQETVDPIIDPPTESIEIVETIVEEEIVTQSTDEPLKEEVSAENDYAKAELAELDATLEDACKMIEALVEIVEPIETIVEEEIVTQSTDEPPKEEVSAENDYANLVEEGRQQFQKEIEAIFPGKSLSESGGLSEEELNIFMTHAYRKVCQLQDELAKAQLFSQRSSSEDSASLSEIDLQSELDAQRRELEVDQHRKLTDMREEMEKELRTQMKRQISAHADHIKDVLEVQEKELNRIHERALDESLSNEHASHKQELAKIKGWLDALEQSMVERASMAEAVFESQKFWLACVSLQKTVEAGADKATVEASVGAVVDAVQNSTTFREDVLVQTLLNSIPKADVPASSEIKTRFNKVEAMARRTALVGEEGGSLMLYVLSYLQSLLIIPPAMTTAMPHKSDDVIDVASLNTFDIAWLARKAIEVDDLEQAVKYLNLLTGEPRRQASDWLVIARLYLELQQSCEALASYAHAIGAEAVPVVAASYK